MILVGHAVSDSEATYAFMRESSPFQNEYAYKVLALGADALICSFTKSMLILSKREAKKHPPLK